MANLWAHQIMVGNKTYDQVPRMLKERVAEILHELALDTLIIDD